MPTRDTRNSGFSQKQLIFQEIFIGTLIYAVVLGFLNDYTSIVYARSFSTIFFASVVLEILTYLAFQLKKVIIGWLKHRNEKIYQALMFFFIWLIMFLSKFVFIFALNLFFGYYISVNGFFGILLVVLCVTLIHRIACLIFNKLGNNNFLNIN